MENAVSAPSLLSRMVAVAALACLPACCDLFDMDCPPTQVPDSECWFPRAAPADAPCGPDVEPNDTMPMARGIPNPGCTLTKVPGALSGQDVDIFHARGERCESGRPRLELESEGVRACLFVQCSTGSTGAPAETGHRFCDDGTMAVRQPNGLLGCCLSAPGAIGIDVVCSTTRNKLDAFVTVDGNADSCTEYDVSFRL